MSAEQRLRAAIRARTSSVEPSPHALNQIEEKLMTAQHATTRNRVLGVAAAAAIVAVVVGFALASGEDDQITAGDPTTTVAPTSTTSSTVSPAVDPSIPVFPAPADERHFLDPRDAATAFATELLGFRTPVVSEYLAGDNRSGEVEIRGFAGGRPTTVAVRRLEDDTWYVLGAATESIRLDEPTHGATIGSPLPLTGAAWAFEGHVAVRLFADGFAAPIGETYVLGRGDAMGDFVGELSFEIPDGATSGVLVLFEPSAQDGSTVGATVIRVHF